MHHARQAIEVIAVLGTIASIAYFTLCLWSAAAFLRGMRRSKSAGGGARPTQPVSILKPLRGADPKIYESLRSHCVQDYPEYEIVFGVNVHDDPAVETVERLKKEFPGLVIQLVVCDKNLGANTKVSNLAQMLPVARYQNLIVNDSDIRVEQDYLQRVLEPLSDPTVGMVTCLYRGIAAATLGSRLESLGISTDFCAGVLAARQLEGGVRFGLGSTLAFRRRDLDPVGGFEGIVDYLADDYEIGSRMAARGFHICLSDMIVETLLPAYSIPEYVRHQLRWARSIRDSRRWGYAGLLLTFGLPWALLALTSAQGAAWAWTLLALVLLARIATAFLVGRGVLGDPQIIHYAWLIPLRDIVAPMLWIFSLTGHTVVWRGDIFTLKDGKLARMSP
jgi:ceramide glucosyltransferase